MGGRERERYMPAGGRERSCVSAGGWDGSQHWLEHAHTLNGNFGSLVSVILIVTFAQSADMLAASTTTRET